MSDRHGFAFAAVSNDAIAGTSVLAGSMGYASIVYVAHAYSSHAMHHVFDAEAIDDGSMPVTAGILVWPNNAEV